MLHLTQVEEKIIDRVMERLKNARLDPREAFIQQCKATNTHFLLNNRKRVYIEYVRETDSPAQIDAFFEGKEIPKGRPTAVMVAFKKDDGVLDFGWSAAFPGLFDEKGNVIKPPEREFSKPIGLWKAIRRATKQGKGTEDRIPPQRLNQYIPSFMHRAHQELLINK